MREGYVKLYAVDIETVSQGKIACEYTDNKSYKLGNVKDPLKIEAKLKEKRDEARGRHALTWWTGKIVSLSIVDVFGDDEDRVIYGYDEEYILKTFSELVDNSTCRLIGKTSENFDFPFLGGRYMANNIQVPRVLRSRYDLLDCDKFFGYSSAAGQRGSLNDYAQGLGLDMKPMSGGQVGKLYGDIVTAKMSGDTVAEKAGWKELTDYNLHDSRIVAEMARRYYGDSGGWM